MGLADILQAMESEAAREREGILAEARATAERILAQARAEAEVRRRQRVESELRSVRAEQARQLNDAKLACLKRLAAARDSLLDTAFRDAGDRLARLRGSPAYEHALRRLLVEAAAEVGPGPIVLRVDPSDVGLARELSAALGLAAQVQPTAACVGGLDVADAEGRIVVHNTFESRLRRAREALRPQLTAIVEAGLAAADGALGTRDLEPGEAAQPRLPAPSAQLPAPRP